MGQCRLFCVSGYLSLWWYDGVNAEAKPLMGKGYFPTGFHFRLVAKQKKQGRWNTVFSSSC